MTTTLRAPVHPGEVLLEECLEAMGITQYRLAKDLSVSPRRINKIVHGNRPVTADTAESRGPTRARRASWRWGS